MRATSLLLLGCLSVASVSAAERACDRLVVTGSPDLPPFVWQTADGSGLQGASVELMKRLARRLDVEVEILDVGDRRQVQTRLDHGQVDIRLDAFWQDARTLQVDHVHPPLFRLPLRVWTLKGAALDYRSLQSLQGVPGVRVRGLSIPAAETQLADKGLSLQTVNSLAAALRRLESGRAAYLLLPWPAGVEPLRPDLLQMQEPPLLEQSLHLAIAHDSACNDGWLRGHLTRALLRMKAEGLPEQLFAAQLQRWLQGQGLPDPVLAPLPPAPSAEPEVIEEGTEAQVES